MGWINFQSCSDLMKLRMRPSTPIELAHHEKLLSKNLKIWTQYSNEWAGRGGHPERWWPSVQDDQDDTHLRTRLCPRQDVRPHVTSASCQDDWWRILHRRQPCHLWGWCWIFFCRSEIVISKVVLDFLRHRCILLPPNLPMQAVLAQARYQHHLQWNFSC